MNFPIGPKDVKVVEGHSGKGLQVVCSCGCVNWNHIEIAEATWPCRNCGQILSYNFPGLAERVKALIKAEASGPSK